jgi:hypothetical protein
MNARPRFVITFTPGPGVDGIRSLRLLLKAAKRRFDLVATDAYEDRSAPLEISNQVADKFQELRDEVVAGRAQAWRSLGDVALDVLETATTQGAAVDPEPAHIQTKEGIHQ